MDEEVFVDVPDPRGQLVHRVSLAPSACWIQIDTEDHQNGVTWHAMISRWAWPEVIKAVEQVMAQRQVIAQAENVVANYLDPDP